VVEWRSLGRIAELRSRLPRNASTSVGQHDCISLAARSQNIAAERADSLLMRRCSVSILKAQRKSDGVKLCRYTARCQLTTSLPNNPIKKRKNKNKARLIDNVAILGKFPNALDTVSARTLSL
jgi:hypothetical protein